MPAAREAVQDSVVPDTHDEGLRERKKRATRRGLRLAALSLVVERGLDRVSTDEIAAAADVSPRTFFNYFRSKEDALLGNDPGLPSALGLALARRPPEEEPMAALRAVFLAYSAGVVLDEEIWRLRMRVIGEHPELLPALIGASAEVERSLTTVVAARAGVDPVRDPYPALVANVAVGAARTAVQHCAVGGFTRPLADVVAEIFDVLMAGLPAPA